MSARWSTVFALPICSGGMKEKVPRLWPISVSVSPPTSFGTLEMPKSRIFTRVVPSGPPLEEDVRRLEVAVDDARAVRVREAHPDLLDDGVQLVDRDGAGALEPVDQALALEQLEDEDDAVLGVLLDVEDLRHVVAVDRARRARLLPEARDGAVDFPFVSCRSSLIATGRPVRMFSAAKTSPMPPRPRGRGMRYRFATTVPGSRSKRVASLLIIHARADGARFFAVPS